MLHIAQLTENRWQQHLAVLLLALPWIVEPQVDPTPVLVPWLTTLACIALLLMMQPYGTGSGERVAGWVRGEVLARAWLLAAVISTVIAACQYLDVETLFPLMSVSERSQVYGNLRQRNQYATLTMIGLLTLCLWDRQEDANTAARRPWLLLALTAFLAAGNAVSGSRTGMVELLLVTALSLAWTKGRSSRVMLAVAWLAYAVTAVIVGLRAEFGSAGGILARAIEHGQPCGSRAVLWQNVLTLIGQRPWSGWGWGELDYAHFVTAYPGIRQCELIDNAHNLPLHLAVELGVPVALAACCAVLYGLWRGRPWREADPARQLAWGVLGVIALHSLVEYPLWYGPFMLSALVSLALLLRSKPASGVASGHALRMTMALALIILLAVAYAAWDYFRVSQIYRNPEQRALNYREHTLEKIRASWLFRNQARFAEFMVTPLTPGNAEQMYAMGLELLHYSPEARVVEKLIECAVMTGRDDEARFFLQRYKAAYPREHALWAGRQLPQVQPAK